MHVTIERECPDCHRMVSRWVETGKATYIECGRCYERWPTRPTTSEVAVQVVLSAAWWAWDFWRETWLVLLLIAAGAVIVVALLDAYAAQRAQFMAECLQDHKRYECEALWGQTMPDTVVVPVYTGR